MCLESFLSSIISTDDPHIGNSNHDLMKSQLSDMMNYFYSHYIHSSTTIIDMSTNENLGTFIHLIDTLVFHLEYQNKFIQKLLKEILTNFSSILSTSSLSFDTRKTINSSQILLKLSNTILLNSSDNSNTEGGVVRISPKNINLIYQSIFSMITKYESMKTTSLGKNNQFKKLIRGCYKTLCLLIEHWWDELKLARDDQESENNPCLVELIEFFIQVQEEKENQKGKGKKNQINSNSNLDSSIFEILSLLFKFY